MANIVGLLPKTFYSPAVSIRGCAILDNGLLKRVPGAMVTTGVYANLTLVTCMAVNRFTSFKSRVAYERLFCKNRSRLAVFICLTVGLLWGAQSVTGRCYADFDPKMFKYFYKRTHVALHTTLMKIYIGLALPTIVILYSGALYHFHKIR